MMHEEPGAPEEGKSAEQAFGYFCALSAQGTRGHPSERRCPLVLERTLDITHVERRSQIALASRTPLA